MTTSVSLHGWPESSFIAGSAIASKGLALKLTAKNTVAIATGDTDEVIGLSADDIETGQTHIGVVTAGYAEAKLGGTVTYGQKLTADSAGRLVAINADTDRVCAIAMEGGAINEFIEVLIVPGAISSQDSTGIKMSTTTILTAAVLTLNATPVSLVPTPGAGKAIVVHKIIASVDYNSAAYATNVTMEFRYTDGSGTKVSADIAALLDATADKVVTVSGIEAALVATPNAPIIVRVATGDPVTGNSPIKITVIYTEVTI